MALLAGLVLGGALPFAAAKAQDFSANGYLDARVVHQSNTRTWLEGGLGKLRYGSDSGGADQVWFGEAVLDARAELDPSFALLGTFRAEPRQNTGVDILEAYARYQPVSTPSWAATIRAGAFFPPISLENESTGWTSPWTLTPSAINTWVGEELRTIGGEANLELRHDNGSVTLTGSVFGWNDPAGVLIADRGWALDDRPTGLFDRIRLPDAAARAQRQPIPLDSENFKEIDGRPGWYAGISWNENELGRLSILHYDNRADPSATWDRELAWKTDFTSVGLETYIDEFVLLAQGMAGRTTIIPSAFFSSRTDFQSAYLLVGRYFGDWRVAGRIDVFATQDHRTGTSLPLSEHGHAFTAAATWQPLSWLRLTAEGIVVESFRAQRIQLGLGPNASETQLQLSTRLMF